MKILLDRIKGSPRPIRTSWDEDALNELAKSIAEQGVIVPIKVRPVPWSAPTGEKKLTGELERDGDVIQSYEEVSKYGWCEIVYGHRRVEAARRANLTEIEAIVEGVDDTAALVQALIENVQREDMPPIDEASGYRLILDETGWSVEVLASKVGKRAQHIYNMLSILDESPTVQDLLVKKQGGRQDTDPGSGITERHIREVRRGLGLPTDTRETVLKKAFDEGLTTRQTRAVAETVARTADPERRKALLETPYNQFVHNPEYAEANEQMARAAAPSPGEEFDRLPAIAVGLEAMKEFRKTMTLMLEACKVGKASPEARRFFARRIDGMIQFLTSIKEGLAE